MHVVGRIGRTTFAVLARIDANAMADLARRVEHAAAQPHLIHGSEVNVHVSIAIGLSHAGEEPKAILDQEFTAPLDAA